MRTRFKESHYYHRYQILKQDLGIKELTKRLNLTRTTLYLWESGRSSPTATTGGRLERIYEEHIAEKTETLELKLSLIKAESEQAEESDRKKSA